MNRPSIAARVLLLVEDNPADAETVRTLLNEADSDLYRVEHAGRLSEAVAILKAEPVDVVLLDLNLPDCTGLDSVRAVHEAAGGAPIVVLTGVGDDRLGQACMDAGAQDYLEKDDVRSRNLLRAIGYAITRVRETQLRELKDALDAYRELSSATQHTSVTAVLAGSGPMSLQHPEIFNGIVAAYFDLIAPYLGGHVTQLNPPRTQMEHVATRLGDANAGPRDLLDVHLMALERANELGGESQSRIIVFESRLLALQMMGLLVEYYRVGRQRRFAEGAHR
ncbi:MAG: response regulator [Phenylobacterium sp.]|uniref:response regulator n=1 Tax=Phenylobacterium sp. TaxID=1871053 RepID=UPI0025FAC610|nr:response regulator [Phenylobacterium sp.]MBI1200413.1 response regulator [Phenylobacterium sp.]